MAVPAQTLPGDAVLVPVRMQARILGPGTLRRSERKGGVDALLVHLDLDAPPTFHEDARQLSAPWHDEIVAVRHALAAWLYSARYND